MSAVNKTLSDRAKTHGQVQDVAALTERLQNTMADGINWSELGAVQRYALSMISVKIARLLSGDPTHTDHWHDIAGYAELGEGAAREFSARSDRIKPGAFADEEIEGVFGDADPKSDDANQEKYKMTKLSAEVEKDLSMAGGCLFIRDREGFIHRFPTRCMTDEQFERLEKELGGANNCDQEVVDERTGQTITVLANPEKMGDHKTFCTTCDKPTLQRTTSINQIKGDAVSLYVRCSGCQHRRFLNYRAPWLPPSE